MRIATDTDWVDALNPRLQEITDRIAELEAELTRLHEMRRGLSLLIEAAKCERSQPSLPANNKAAVLKNGQRLTAKECLIRVLQEAGGPLPWSELQQRIARLPHPPTAGSLTSAFYHNTKSGSRQFLTLGDGYAGLSGRDEGWKPKESAKAVSRSEATEMLSDSVPMSLARP